MSMAMSAANAAREYQDAEANARRYLTQNGERLNRSAILVRFRESHGLTFHKFDHLRNVTLPKRGVKLSVVEMPTPARPIGGCPWPKGFSIRPTENTFSEDEVAAALNWSPYLAADDTTSAGWIDVDTYRDRNGRIFATVAGARVRFPSLSGMDLPRFIYHPSRYLTDPRTGAIRIIKHRWVTAPIGRARCGRSGRGPARTNNVDGKILVLLIDHLGEIDRKRAQPQPMVDHIPGTQKRPPQRRRNPDAVHKDGLGEWLTDRQAFHRHGVTQHFLRYWSNKLSIDPARKGKMALQKKKIPNPYTGQGGRSKVTVSRDDDILRILAGEEGNGTGVGKGPNAERLRLEKLSKAQEAFKSILADGPLPPKQVFQLARERFRVGEAHVKRMFHLYGMREKGPIGRTLWRLRPGIVVEPHRPASTTSVSAAQHAGLPPVPTMPTSDSSGRAVAHGDADADNVRSPRPAVRQPSKKAIATYRLWFATGKTQKELADDPELMESLGRKVEQGTISRWLSQVKAWIEAGNVLPSQHDESTRSKPHPMDPARIDLGENQEHRPAHQREKRNSGGAD